MSDEQNNFPNSEKQPAGMPQYPPPYRYRERRSNNWWIPVIIVVGVIGLFLLGGILLVVSMGSMFEQKTVTVNENSVLFLDLSNIQEYAQPNPFAAISGNKTSVSLLETLTAIERAKDDDRILGIYYKPSTAGGLGFTKANEVRQALLDFKTSGKFIYAYIDMASEASYFNALVADSIFMPREGMLEMNGFGTSGMFLKGLFEKVGVNWHVEQFEDFKSAGESYSREQFSDSARLQIEVILNHRLETFINAITESRKLGREQILTALNQGLITPDSILKHGFIDGFLSETDMKLFIERRISGKDFSAIISKYDAPLEDYINRDWQLEEKEKENGKVRFVRIGQYMQSSPPTNKTVYDNETQIAIINGVGAIMPGRSEPNPFGGEYQISSGDFVRYIKAAREDEKVKAIIIRIDSPGGSVLASDEIWDEIIKTRQLKPVYASMSDVAASGGYYIAMACDTIVAHPSTITGSIGVILAIPNLNNTMNKLDVTIDTISTNNNAQALNQMLPFSDYMKDELNNLGRGVYNRFVEKVAYSRGKTFEETRSLAKGRVWTGEDAYNNGLVDVLGGIKETLALAKKRLGIPEDNLVYVRNFPEEEDPVEALLKMFGLDEESDVQSNSNVFNSNLFGADPVKSFLNWSVLPSAVKREIQYQYSLAKMSQNERFLLAMPYLIHVE